MSEWVGGQMDECLGGRVSGKIDGCMDGQMDGLMG